MKQMFLTICGLTVLWAMGGVSGAQVNVPPLPEAHMPREVPAFGVDAAKAREIAVNQATLLVRKLLEAHDYTSFKPDTKYVRENILEDEGRPGQDERNEAVGEQPLKSWIVTFKSSNWWQEVVRRDYEAQRISKSAYRQTAAKYVVVGILVSLAIANGCVQINRLTRGRHSLWWLAVGVGIISVLVAGILLLLA